MVAIAVLSVRVTDKFKESLSNIEIGITKPLAKKVLFITTIQMPKLKLSFGGQTIKWATAVTVLTLNTNHSFNSLSWRYNERCTGAWDSWRIGRKLEDVNHMVDISNGRVCA